MNNFKSTLENIFEIIGYKGDKEELYNQLLGICYLNAADNLIETLPEENRQTVRKEVSSISDPKQLGDTVNKYFNQQQFNEALQKSSETVFKEYIETIRDSLSEDQINKLNTYITSVKSQLNP